jgi:hypothetical protein
MSRNKWGRSSVVMVRVDIEIIDEMIKKCNDNMIMIQTRVNDGPIRGGRACSDAVLVNIVGFDMCHGC